MKCLRGGTIFAELRVEGRRREILISLRTIESLIDRRVSIDVACADFKFLIAGHLGCRVYEDLFDFVGLERGVCVEHQSHYTSGEWSRHRSTGNLRIERNQSGRYLRVGVQTIGGQISRGANRNDVGRKSVASQAALKKTTVARRG